MGGKTGGGYGFITRGADTGSRNHYLAHRVGWTLHYGPIPAGTYVCHRCDNPACNNPRHLFLGTPSENSMDREAKGRSNRRRGERVRTSKLSNDDVRSIRVRNRQGESARSIARSFGMAHATINKILVGNAWTHVI